MTKILLKVPLNPNQATNQPNYNGKPATDSLTNDWLRGDMVSMLEAGRELST